MVLFRLPSGKVINMSKATVIFAPNEDGMMVVFEHHHTVRLTGEDVIAMENFITREQSRDDDVKALLGEFVAREQLR